MAAICKTTTVTCGEDISPMQAVAPEPGVVPVPFPGQAELLLGHVALKLEMLGHYGTVMTVCYDPGHSNAESMAGDIKAAVEAKTGLPLDSSCR
ncbi:hypothetical protein ABBQ38_013616 [Trebouxia sp. C0009 RCD-2024]